MKNTVKLLGIIAIAAIIGFTMAACDSDSGGSSNNKSGGGGGGTGGGRIPAELVGKWGQSSAYESFEIKADGSGTITYGNIAVRWTATATTLTGTGAGQTDTVNWEIRDGRLYLTGGSGGLSYLSGYSYVKLGGSGGGSIPAELAGRWGASIAGYTQEVLLINTNGSGSLSTVSGYTWTVSGNILSASHSGVYAGSVDYEIKSDGKLYLTNGTSALMTLSNISSTVDGLIKL